MLSPGEIVERYEVLHHLGGGATAEVYLVRHVDLDTRFALKVLTQANTALQERLIQEGRIQARIRHKNVVAVHDVLRVGPLPALLMDFVEGPALDTLIQQYTPNLAQVDDLARGILAGMAHAHQQGLVHRDLKPANILVAPSGASVVPKVADFGLVKVLDPEPGSRRTRTGATLGTPAFMAPEQMRSSAHVDARADVFALGCVLYELVCGAPAFVDHDLISLHQAMSAKRWRPVRDWMPSVPQRMETAIRQALEPDPEDRPDDAGALMALWTADTPMPEGVWEPEHLALIEGLAPTRSGHAPGVAATAAATGTAAAPRTGEEGSLVGEEPEPSQVGRSWGLPVVIAAVTVVLGAGALGVAALVGLSFLAWEGVETGDPDGLDAASEQAADEAAGQGRPPGDPLLGLPSDPDEPDKSGAPSSGTTASATPPAAGSRPSTASGSPSASESGSASESAADSKPASSSTSAAATPPPAEGSWSVTGTERAWVLDARDRRFEPGPLPPGRYRLFMGLDGRSEPLEVSTFSISPGKHRSFSCVPALRNCKEAE